MLEKAQLHCLQAMTGQYQTSPADLVRLEAGSETSTSLQEGTAPSLRNEPDIKACNAQQALLLQEGYMLVAHGHRCCQRGGSLGPPSPCVAPAQQGTKCLGAGEVGNSLQGGSSRTSPIEVRLADALATIRSHGTVDLTYYTDGSATLGLFHGGSAVFMIQGALKPCKSLTSATN